MTSDLKHHFLNVIISETKCTHINLPLVSQKIGTGITQLV
jgi:hypothetical protein